MAATWSRPACARLTRTTGLLLADRDADSSATPVTRHSADHPCSRKACPDSGTASTSAKMRYVVSSGSTSDSSRWPIDQAARMSPSSKVPEAKLPGQRLPAGQ